MLQSKYIASLLLAATLASCTKRDKLDTPDFNVQTAKAEYKTGDTITFNISGEPDIITFWSGEKGNDYQFRDRTVMDGGVPKLSFSTQVLYGGQMNSLFVMASTDFSGKYTTADIQAANWIDITSRFKLDPTAANLVGVETQSGLSEISDLLVKDKPIYIAYYYKGITPPSASEKQRTWRVLSFNLNAYFPDGTVGTIANLASGGWAAIDVLNTTNKWSIATTKLEFAPNSATADSEDWVISEPFVVSTALPVNPDRGVAIKEFSQRKKAHSYTYEKPGKYKVAFVAANTNARDLKKTVKEIELTIIP